MEKDSLSKEVNTYTSLIALEDGKINMEIIITPMARQNNNHKEHFLLIK